MSHHEKQIAMLELAQLRTVRLLLAAGLRCAVEIADKDRPDVTPTLNIGYTSAVSYSDDPHDKELWSVLRIDRSGEYHYVGSFRDMKHAVRAALEQYATALIREAHEDVEITDVGEGDVAAS